METSRKAFRFASSLCLLALAACSSGGGGGTPAAATPTTPAPTTPTTPAPTTPAPAASISIEGPGTTSVSGIGGAGQGSNFTSDPPPVGTTVGFGSATVSISPTGAATTIADAKISSISAVYKGTITSGGVVYPVFDLSIPALSLTASNVRGDGTPVSAGGGQVSAVVAGMTYTLLGAWTFTASGSGASYLGQVVTGYSTPTGNVPTTGTANYAGNPNVAGAGGVVGAYFVPSGSGTIQAGVLTGNVNMTVNFAANTTSGSLNNMTAKATGSSTSTPWNVINLTGTLTRGAGGVTVGGGTATTGAPVGAGTAGFSSSSVGGFSAMLFGPNAQELGGTWQIQEFPGTANGKAAFGTFGAKQ